jgi:hypothetical protein
MLSTTYKMSSNILLSRLSLYTAKVIRDRQRGFRRKRSSTVQIFFCIRQALEKK